MINEPLGQDKDLHPALPIEDTKFDKLNSEWIKRMELKYRLVILSEKPVEFITANRALKETVREITDSKLVAVQQSRSEGGS